eukprot:COSAG02_NODE_46184_length_351_cov_0.607143_1_plen_34_part_01
MWTQSAAFARDSLLLLVGAPPPPPPPRRPAHRKL